MYVALAEDYYEVADTFPTGDNIDGLYDWIGLWTYKDLASAVDSKKVLLHAPRADGVAAPAMTGGAAGAL